MDCFNSIFTIFGFIADICILGLTIFTVYKTTFSTKLTMLPIGHFSSSWYGMTLFLHLKNHTLHPIAVTEVFLMTRIEGVFYRISFTKYDEPLIIDGWHIAKIETDPFTEIRNIDIDRLININKETVVGVVQGSRTTWIKPAKKSPLQSAKKLYQKREFQIATVYRKEYNNQVLSKNIRFAVHIKMFDIAGNTEVKTIYVHPKGLLSDSINGYNAIPAVNCSDADTLRDFLIEHFEIPKENIAVKTIGELFDAVVDNE